MKLNRKTFLKTLGGIGSTTILAGCVSNDNGESKIDYEKLAATLEQAGFIVSLKFKSDPAKRKYLEEAVLIIDQVVADKKFDPTDILSLVLAKIKNDDVVLAITSALLIYKIWFNDSLPEVRNDNATKLLVALSTGIKNGLSQPSVRSRVSYVPPTLKSKSLNNAVKTHFEEYQ
jgi:hypothetical protein